MTCRRALVFSALAALALAFFIPIESRANEISVALEGTASISRFDTTVGNFLSEFENDYHQDTGFASSFSVSGGLDELLGPLAVYVGSQQALAQAGTTVAVDGTAFASFVVFDDRIPLTDVWRIRSTAIAKFALTVTEPSTLEYFVDIPLLSFIGGAGIILFDPDHLALLHSEDFNLPGTEAFSTVLLPGFYRVGFAMVMEQDSIYYEVFNSNSIGIGTFNIDLSLTPTQVPEPGALFLVLVGLAALACSHTGQCVRQHL